MDDQTPHLIDFTTPIEEWEGYLCPVDGKLHKDGKSLF